MDSPYKPTNYEKEWPNQFLLSTERRCYSEEMISPLWVPLTFIPDLGQDWLLIKTAKCITPETTIQDHNKLQVDCKEKNQNKNQERWNTLSSFGATT